MLRQPLITSLLACALFAQFLFATTDAHASRLNPLDVVVAIDDSGSEFGTKGTDPQALRYAAARFAAEFLGSISTPGLDNRVGLVRFGTAAPADSSLALTPVPAGLTKLDRALAAPKSLGATNFAAAIDRAQQVFGPARPGRTRVLLIFTDGTPNLNDGRTTAELFKEIARSRSRLKNVEVTLLGVDRTGRFADMTPQWKSAGIDAVEEIRSTREDQLSRAFARLLSKSLGLDRGNEITLNSGQRTWATTLDPYQEALVLSHFSPDKETSVEAVPPGGTPAGLTRRGRAGIARIKEPTPGKWTFRLKSGSSAIIAVDRVPIQAVLRNPIAAKIPVGRPIDVEATFQTSDGRDLRELSAFPRYFGATVTGPDGSPHPVQLRRVGPGVYQANAGVEAKQPGQYRVDLSVKGAEKETLQQDSRTVTAAITPYFESDVHEVNSREHLRVPLKLMLNGHALEANTAVTDDPNAVGVARLYDIRGRLLETARMKAKGGPDFEAFFRTEPNDDQYLTLVTTLTGTAPDGQTVSDQYRTLLHANPSTTSRVMDVVWMVLWSVLAMTAVALAAIAAWWFSRPRASGSYVVNGKARRMNKSRLVLGSGWPVQPVTFVWGAGKNRVKYREGRLPLPFGAKDAESSSKARKGSIVG